MNDIAFPAKNDTSILIRGGHALQGEVRVPADKIALMHLLTATVLSNAETFLKHTHLCSDVTRIITWLRQYTDVCITNGVSIRVCPHTEPRGVVHAPPNRSGLCLVAPLALGGNTVRFGNRVECGFAARLIDQHLVLAHAFGIDIVRKNDWYEATKRRSPRAVEVSCATRYGPSVGVTCHGLMAAFRFPGEIILHAPAREPVVSVLIEYLTSATGRDVEVSASKLVIPKLVQHDYRPTCVAVPRDLNVAVTLMACGIATRGILHLSNVTSLSYSIHEVLDAMHLSLRVGDDGLMLDAQNGVLHPRSVHCRVWPGVPSDCGPLLAAALLRHAGVTTVIDHVYDKRSSHVRGLRAMGYRVSAEGNMVTVRGSTPHARHVDVRAPDIRAGAALVVGALARNGITTVHGYDEICRGYADLPGMLRALGLEVSQIRTGVSP